MVESPADRPAISVRHGWALVVMALVIRVLALLVRHEYAPPADVGAEAGVIAQHIAAGEGFTSPFDRAVPRSASTQLPPAYPYFLAGLLKMGLSMVGVFYVAVAVNLLAGALLPWVTVRVGLAAGFPRAVCFIGGWGMCVCPEALRAVGLVWDESLFVLGSALLMWWMLAELAPQRAVPSARRAALIGLASGFFALLNPALAPAVPLAWAAGLLARQVSLRTAAGQALLIGVMTVVGSLPWNVRNWLVLDPPAPVFVRGSFWCVTWSAIHPLEAYTRADGTSGLRALHPWSGGGGESLDRVEDGGVVHLTERQYFDWCRERTLAAFHEEPRLLLVHVAHQFDSFWLGMAEARRWHKSIWPFLLAQGVPAVAGILGLFAARRRANRVALSVFTAMLIVFPLPYYLSDASARYRHPVDFILYLGAAWLAYLIYARARPDRLAPSETAGLATNS